MDDFDEFYNPLTETERRMLASIVSKTISSARGMTTDRDKIEYLWKEHKNIIHEFKENRKKKKSSESQVKETNTKAYQYLKNPKDEVEKYINKYIVAEIMSIARSAGTKPEAIINGVWSHYRAGYCYHFAHMLKTVFKRGTVAWAAPFSHIVFLDVNGNAYDCEGKYHDGEVFYFIPEEECDDTLEVFSHVKSDAEYHQATREELITIMKNYCHNHNCTYDKRVEDYLK